MIGEEAKAQFFEEEGRLPDYVIACVGGGSNAIGMFNDFIQHEEVKLTQAFKGPQTESYRYQTSKYRVAGKEDALSARLRQSVRCQAASPSKERRKL